jgi:NADPH:quinone reductase-like Zn-dependent oxidoreductase
MNAQPTPSEPMMKALRAHHRGGPEQLVYEDAPRPVPTGGEVCVRVEVAAITFDELTWPETWEREGVVRTPVIPSHEFSGVVAAVGSEVGHLTVGDAVFGLVPFDRDGAAAEYVLVPEDCCARRPDNVSNIVAAAAALPALTAWEALGEHVALAAGQRLLVHGATGAVGSFVTQFAHRQGLSVTGTVRTATAVTRARQLGADEVLVTGETLPGDLKPFDAAVNAAGADTPAWLYRAVRRGGRLITLQEPPDQELAAEQGIDARFFIVRLRRSELEGLAGLLAQGGTEVAIAQTFPLSQGQVAYASRDHSPPGKTVLLVRPN